MTITAGLCYLLKDMNKKKIPNSIKKFIRKEKAHIRRQFFDIKKQYELIEELYKNFKINKK